jgi:hypothetical protein
MTARTIEDISDLPEFQAAWEGARSYRRVAIYKNVGFHSDLAELLEEVCMVLERRSERQAKTVLGVMAEAFDHIMDSPFSDWRRFDPNVPLDGDRIEFSFDRRTCDGYIRGIGTVRRRVGSFVEVTIERIDTFYPFKDEHGYYDYDGNPEPQVGERLMVPLSGVGENLSADEREEQAIFEAETEARLNQ